MSWGQSEPTDTRSHERSRGAQRWAEDPPGCWGHCPANSLTGCHLGLCATAQRHRRHPVGSTSKGSGHHNLCSNIVRMGTRNPSPGHEGGPQNPEVELKLCFYKQLFHNVQRGSSCFYGWLCSSGRGARVPYPGDSRTTEHGGGEKGRLVRS